ncbi:MAG: TasA family protein [Candidatus Paceibacterota bacterium]
MKKIILSLAVIALTATAAVGATRAWFSDTETSTGNTFTAGTLDLKVNQADSLPVVIANVVPGSSESAPVVVTNSGNVNGKYLKLNVTDILDHENTTEEPEIGADGETGLGELCGEVIVTLSETKDEVTTTFYNAALKSFPTAGIELGELAGGATRNLTVSYSVPSTVGNKIQSDSCTFNMAATLEQER